MSKNKISDCSSRNCRLYWFSYRYLPSRALNSAVSDDAGSAMIEEIQGANMSPGLRLCLKP